MDESNETETLINPSVDMDTELNHIPQVTEEDKENFFKSILSDSPYEETVNLFDGKLKLTFQAMSVQENSDIVGQIVLDRKNGTAAENDAYLVTIASYRLAVSLKQINGAVYSDISKGTFKPASDKDTYILARTRPMLDWATPKLSAYLDAFKQFERKMLTLTREVQNRNFWKASA